MEMKKEQFEESDEVVSSWLAMLMVMMTDCLLSNSNSKRRGESGW